MAAKHAKAQKVVWEIMSHFNEERIAAEKRMIEAASTRDSGDPVMRMTACADHLKALEHLRSLLGSMPLDVVTKALEG